MKFGTMVKMRHLGAYWPTPDELDTRAMVITDQYVFTIVPAKDGVFADTDIHGTDDIPRNWEPVEEIV